MEGIGLTPDQLKVLYRGNFTLKQAALYLGIGDDKVLMLINEGKLGVNYVFGKRYISRQECDRYLKDNTRYESKSWKSKIKIGSQK